MSESQITIAELLRQDRRYKLEAYAFVFEALRHGHDIMGLGTERQVRRKAAGDEPRVERHLSGQQLCEAIRQYALEQYGYMARTVLESWGVTSTGDFGEIVFNLIRVGEMRKTKDDRRKDFDDVFDFETGLTQSFQITLPEERADRPA